MAKIYLNKSVSLELGPQASFLSERNNFDEMQIRLILLQV
jgi:hypothetical protein